MKRSAFISLFGTSLAGAVAAGEPPPAPAPAAGPPAPAAGESQSNPTPTGHSPAARGVEDPRTGPSLTIFYKNQKNSNMGLSDAVMVYARVDFDREKEQPNQILGVKGSFTDEQIVSSVKRFYKEWRSPPDVLLPRPKLILAIQNWGGGGGLYEPFRKISEEFEIDVYTLYPVTDGFGNRPGSPTDERIGEILKKP